MLDKDWNDWNILREKSSRDHVTLWTPSIEQNECISQSSAMLISAGAGF